MWGPLTWHMGGCPAATAACMQSLAGEAAGWLLPEQAQERPGECLLQKLVMMLDADTEPAGVPWRPSSCQIILQLVSGLQGGS